MNVNQIVTLAQRVDKSPEVQGTINEAYIPNSFFLKRYYLQDRPSV